MKEQGENVDWESVKKEMEENGFVKNIKQLRDRWHRQSSPEISHSKWSKAESELLFSLFLIHKNAWKTIAENFEGRSDNCIKNKFFSMIRKAFRNAIKLVNKDNIDSSTSIMNKIKTKILSDFTLFTLKLKDGITFRGENSIRIVDFVKIYSASDDMISLSSIGENERGLITQCFEALLRLNKQYIWDCPRHRKKLINNKKEPVIENEGICIDMAIDLKKEDNSEKKRMIFNVKGYKVLKELADELRAEIDCYQLKNVPKEVNLILNNFDHVSERIEDIVFGKLVYAQKSGYIGEMHNKEVLSSIHSISNKAENKETSNRPNQIIYSNKQEDNSIRDLKIDFEFPEKLEIIPYIERHKKIKKLITDKNILNSKAFWAKKL